MEIFQERQHEWLQIFLKHIRDRTINIHVREDERYKFEAVQHFQAHFDLQTPDLAGNLEEAVLNNNLVAGAMYFPRKMLLLYAQVFPEDTRRVLQNLFDEAQDIGKRITEAQEAFLELEKRRAAEINEKPANTYIGLRFLSLLLSCYDPNQYNALKPAEWRVFCRFIDPGFSMPNHTPAGEQYKIYNSYIEPLREFLKTRSEIKEIKDKLTEGLLFKDDAYRWMTQDVIFVTARAYANTRAKQVETDDQAMDEVGSDVTEIAQVDDLNTGFMAYELHLEEYVIKNWRNINFGEKLEMYLEEDGTTGQQYTTDVGIMDILARDENNDFVVIELKRAESGYKVVGQVLNYMGWVQDKLAAEGQKVRGLIIVGKADKTLRAAIRPVENMISLKEYRMQMSLESPRE
ncbi:MAG TPA: endonuclease NucS domain-containing protein [Candidatus Saccharimonadales bacterium]|nr:endonuclease NucS domain-containing protein [Candidatus Saccharimonadales bacterium]